VRPKNLSGVVVAADSKSGHLIADEIAYDGRLLDLVIDELTNDPIALQRRGTALQSFDLACQTLGHLSAVLKAEDRKAAVDGRIGAARPRCGAPPVTAVSTRRPCRA
jgi:hypothetical protein